MLSVRCYPKLNSIYTFLSEIEAYVLFRKTNKINCADKIVHHSAIVV